jgi:putative salt-induced outer membrane protein YdiY
MKLKNIFFMSFFVFCSFLFTPKHGYSDEIYLKNMDKISGKVLTMSKGILKISTSYSKSIELDKSQVKSLRTNHSVRVKLENGWSVKGKLNPTKDGLYSIKTTKSSRRAIIPFDEIISINAPKAEPKNWKGKIYLGGTQQTGNTDRLTISFGGEGKLKLDTERFEVKFRTIYTEEDDKITSRNTLGRGQYNHFFNDKWYGLLSLEALKDKFKNLNLRLAIGPGAGYVVWDDPIKNLKLEAGLTYFSEDLKSGVDTQFMTGRLSGIFDYQFSETLSFNNKVIIFPSFENVGEFTLRNEAGLSTRLAEAWSLNLSHILDYDNETPVDVKAADSFLILALQYDF